MIESDPRFVLLQRYISSEQFDRAAPLCAELLAIEPECWELHIAAGLCALQTGSLKTASDFLERAVGIRPDQSRSQWLLSICRELQGWRREAIEIAESVVRNDPEDAEYWGHLGRLFWQVGEFRNAIACAEKAIALDPEGSDQRQLLTLARSALAEQEDREPRTDDSIADLRAVLANEPENVEALINLGVVYSKHAENEAAAENCYRRALALDPTNEVARDNLRRLKIARDTMLKVLELPLTLIQRIGDYFQWSFQRVWPILFLLCLTKPLLVVLVLSFALWLAVCLPITLVYRWLMADHWREYHPFRSRRRGAHVRRVVRSAPPFLLGIFAIGIVFGSWVLVLALSGGAWGTVHRQDAGEDTQDGRSRREADGLPRQGADRSRAIGFGARTHD